MRHISLEQGVARLNSLAELKEDILVPQNRIKMFDDSVISIPKNGGYKELEPTDYFHSQLASKLQIPKAYYDRMLERDKTLLALNVNTWLDKSDKRAFVRTYRNGEDRGIARAILSDSYKPIENELVVNALLEACEDKYTIDEFNMDDRNLYIVVRSNTEIEAKNILSKYSANEMALIGGFIVRNSEVGAGAFEISARAIIKVCNNGLIIKNDSYRKVHLGAKLTDDIWSRATIRRNHYLIASQIKDYARRFTSADYLIKIDKQYAEYTQDANNPIELVEKVGTETKIDSELLKKYLHKRQDYSYFGIVQSVTEAAQTLPIATHQFEAEEVAYEILPKLPKWDAEISKN